LSTFIGIHHVFAHGIKARIPRTARTFAIASTFAAPVADFICATTSSSF
jgi:hypothetical protein